MNILNILFRVFTYNWFLSSYLRGPSLPTHLCFRKFDLLIVRDIGRVILGRRTEKEERWRAGSGQRVRIGEKSVEGDEGRRGKEGEIDLKRASYRKYWSEYTRWGTHSVLESLISHCFFAAKYVVVGNMDQISNANVLILWNIISFAHIEQTEYRI